MDIGTERKISICHVVYLFLLCYRLFSRLSLFAMSKRPPNELESRLHQAALSSSKKVRLLTCFLGKFLTILQEITAKQAESIIPDPNARQDALNFLLGVGLFKSLKDSKGHISFRAVTKNELVAYVIGAFRYPFTC